MRLSLHSFQKEAPGLGRCQLPPGGRQSSLGRNARASQEQAKREFPGIPEKESPGLPRNSPAAHRPVAVPQCPEKVLIPQPSLSSSRLVLHKILA